MASKKLYNPAFTPESVDRSAAPMRLVGDLADRRVALIANAWPSWVAMADHLEGRLKERFDNIAVNRYLVPNGSAAAPELLDQIVAENDGAIVGLANCGSCTAWSFHDASELIRAGLPVSWVASGEFDTLAHSLATARKVAVPIVVVPTNPETIELERAIEMADDAFEEIVKSLVEQPVSHPGSAAQASAERFLSISSETEVQDYLYDEGLTDGLPVIVPEPSAIEAMLAGEDPDEIVGYLPPTYFPLTLATLGANAVMAGARPEYLATLKAIVAAACVHEYNLNGMATTTGPSTPMIVVNGPIRLDLDLNCGRGLFGPGRRANAAIGRTLRLVMANVGGAHPGTISKSIMGQPGRYSFCFGEDEEHSPWEPLHVSLGLSPGESAVTLLGATGTMNILTPRQDAEAMITLFADALANMGNPNIMMGKGTVGVVITPGHAEALARAGYEKQEVAAAIAERARIPLERFPEGLRPDPPYEFIERNGYVHAVADAAHVYVIVAGGPEPTHATVVPSHPSCVPVSQTIGSRP